MEVEKETVILQMDKGQQCKKKEKKSRLAKSKFVCQLMKNLCNAAGVDSQDFHFWVGSFYKSSAATSKNHETTPPKTYENQRTTHELIFNAVSSNKPINYSGTKK